MLMTADELTGFVKRMVDAAGAPGEFSQPGFAFWHPGRLPV
jgi:hypothetical protein